MKLEEFQNKKDPTIECVLNLVERVPELRPLLDEHIADQFGQILPHVFFGDVTRYMIDQVRAGATTSKDPASQIMNFLDECLGQGNSRIKELITASFLENLYDDQDVLTWVEDSFGPNFKKHFGSSKADV